MAEEESDYLKFRGRCRELSEAAVAENPLLRLVRGHYIDPQWGVQPHWWTVRPDGTIHDPTAAQFPSKGLGEYVEFDGFVECEECGERVAEADARFDGRHAFCSYTCHGRHVGVM